MLVQYLQVDCTRYIGTAGGKEHNDGLFLGFFARPIRSSWFTTCALFMVGTAVKVRFAAKPWPFCRLPCLYIDEMVAYYGLDILGRFQFYVDSTSAITDVEHLRNLIPRRKYPNNADVLSTMSDAQHVIDRFSLTHVKSHQDEKTEFEKLSFPAAQLNVRCDHMCTAHLKLQATDVSERSQSCHHPTRNMP